MNQLASQRLRMKRIQLQFSDVNEVYPALNQSLLLRQLITSSKYEKISHVTQNGEILWVILFKCGSLVAVVEETLVVVVNISSPTIDIYSLLNRQVVEIKRQFLPHQEIDIFSFQKSHLFCLIEITDHQQYSFSYFQSNFLQKGTKPIHRGVNNCHNPTKFYQLDDYNKIGWYEESVQTIHLKVYSFKRDQQGKIKEEQQSFSFLKPQSNIKPCLLRKIKSNSYLAWNRSQKGLNQYFIVSKDPQTKNVSMQEWNLKSRSNYLRQSIFVGQLRHFFIFLREAHEVRDLIVIDILVHQIAQIHEVASKTTQRCRVSKQLMENRIVVEYFEEITFNKINHTRKKWTVIRLTDLFFNSKELVLQFLLHINDDFDDDLLSDCIDLLEEGDQ